MSEVSGSLYLLLEGQARFGETDRPRKVELRGTVDCQWA